MKEEQPQQRLKGQQDYRRAHGTCALTGILTTPFEKAEVIRSVSRAWQSWEEEWSRVNQRWRKPRVFSQSA